MGGQAPQTLTHGESRRHPPERHMCVHTPGTQTHRDRDVQTDTDGPTHTNPQTHTHALTNTKPVCQKEKKPNLGDCMPKAQTGASAPLPPLPRPEGSLGMDVAHRLGGRLVFLTPESPHPLSVTRLTSFMGPPAPPAHQRTPTSHWSPGCCMMFGKGLISLPCHPQDSLFEPHVASASVFSKEKKKISLRGKFPACRSKLLSQPPGKDTHRQTLSPPLRLP